MKKEIFTIDCLNIRKEESYECAQTWQNYESEEDAITSARSLAKSLKDEDDVYNVSVFFGEYEDENGNVFGEPESFYTISNKGKDETMYARYESGYANTEVNEYNE